MFALLADGLVSGMGEKLATFAVKCLAVAGGFLLGYVLGATIAWALDRWIFAKKAPEPLKKSVSIVCAIALAILVALIVFGEGGGGLFGGGGQGDGRGTPANDSGKVNPDQQPDPKDKQPKIDPVKLPDPQTRKTTVYVTVLGGEDVRNERFYLIDEDANPKTFTELKEAVAARRETEKGKLEIAIRFPKKNVLSDDHPAVTQVFRWAKEVKLKIGFEWDS